MRGGPRAGAVVVSDDVATASRMASAGRIRRARRSALPTLIEDAGMDRARSLYRAHHGPQLRSLGKSAIRDVLELPSFWPCDDSPVRIGRRHEETNVAEGDRVT